MSGSSARSVGDQLAQLAVEVLGRAGAALGGKAAAAAVAVEQVLEVERRQPGVARDCRRRRPRGRLQARGREQVQAVRAVAVADNAGRGMQQAAGTRQLDAGRQRPAVQRQVLARAAVIQQQAATGVVLDHRLRLCAAGGGVLSGSRRRAPKAASISPDRRAASTSTTVSGAAMATAMPSRASQSAGAAASGAAATSPLPRRCARLGTSAVNCAPSPVSSSRTSPRMRRRAPTFAWASTDGASLTNRASEVASSPSPASCRKTPPSPCGPRKSAVTTPST